MSMDRRKFLKRAAAGTAAVAGAAAINAAAPGIKHQAIGALDELVQAEGEFRHHPDWKVNQFMEGLMEYYHAIGSRGTEGDTKNQLKKKWAQSKMEAFDPVGFCDTNNYYLQNERLEKIGFAFIDHPYAQGTPVIGKIIEGPDQATFADWGANHEYKKIIFSSDHYVIPGIHKGMIRRGFFFNNRAYMDTRNILSDQSHFCGEYKRISREGATSTDDLLLKEAYELYAKETGVWDPGLAVFDKKAQDVFYDMWCRMSLDHHEPSHHFSRNEQWAYCTQLGHADNMMDQTHGFWQLQEFYPTMFNDDFKKEFLETTDFDKRKDMFKERVEEYARFMIKEPSEDHKRK
ncbi:twin-arginine translocation signal domain-containing protein [Candidatus Woesearchaeota archaeon]|nr:twin-arginine translocation signal domain-containing protein [Candidatus Woesearchaeota archaeon]